MPISLFHGIQSDYVQMVCMQERYHEKLELMGWVKDPELLPDEWPQITDDAENINQLEIIIHNQAKAIEQLQADLDEALSSDNVPSQDAAALAADEEQFIELVNELETKEEVEEFIKKLLNIDIDKRGSLDTVKEKAIAAIKSGK